MVLADDDRAPSVGDRVPMEIASERTLDMVVNLHTALVAEAIRASQPNPQPHRYVSCSVTEVRRQGAPAA